MADIGGLVTAALSGGATGLVGQLINRTFGYFEAKQARETMKVQFAEDEKKRAHETQLLELAMKQKHEEHEQELETAAVAGSWAGLEASIQAEASVRQSYKWVDAVRGMVRPVLTLESQILMALVYFTSRNQEDIRQQATEAILFIATASALWWFGERAERKSKA